MNYEMRYIVYTMNALIIRRTCKPCMRGMWDQDVRAIGRRMEKEMSGGLGD